MFQGCWVRLQQPCFLQRRVLVLTYHHIFDSHAHYDDTAFDPDRSVLLQTLPQQGVCHVIDCGATLAGCRAAVELAQKYPYIHAAVGIHPEEVGASPENWLQQLEKLLQKKEENQIVAVGEIGLDYHFAGNPPRDVQKAAFAAQLQLAAKYKLPVIVHDRDAHADALKLLQQYRPQGVVHCFSGSVETMQELLKLGMYIGLGGAVTFKNAKMPLRVAEAVPLDRLLNETDCPYMAPVPLRGARCDSTMIPYSAKVIAAVRGISTQKVLDAGCENAKRLFAVSDSVAPAV
jgi:TatD DNase family protein